MAIAELAGTAKYLMWCTLSTKPRNHAGMIHAWADGATIQGYAYEEGYWYDAGRPPYTPSGTYRVKPETILYKIACLYDYEHTRHYISVAQNTSEGRELETAVGFIRWITDWIEVEIV